MPAVFGRQFLWPTLRISVSSVTLPSMLERLQKIISRAGIASRRHAEQLIESGQVRVNGRVVKELGTKADIERDRIEAGGRLVELPQGKQYFILHKPPRVVSTMSDPEGRHSLQQLLRGIPTRVYPVGRLDYALSGLLLLTSDGDLANRILKLAPRLPQTYWVKVKGRLAAADLAKLGERLHARVEPIRAPQAARSGAEPLVYGNLRRREPRSAAARIVRNGASGRKAPPCRHSRSGTRGLARRRVPRAHPWGAYPA